MQNTPHAKMLFADDQGTIYDHPRLEMAGCSASAIVRPDPTDLVPLPGTSKLYFHPGCPPCGYDPGTGRVVRLTEARIGRRAVRCHAVSAFIQQGWVRQLLPAMAYDQKKQPLPMWAYSAVGYAQGAYCVPAFQIDNNDRWNPDHFDDRTLLPEVSARRDEFPDNRLVAHLEGCALRYHCFAAKNFFYRRWEAPIPTSPVCNASCLGCISLQPDTGCVAPQERITFVPHLEEIVLPFARHLQQAADPIVSFGQGCEGEPLLQWQRISEAIAAIRRITACGTINLNTNGSLPERVAAICGSGLDSIRVSINSARPDIYHRYYAPRGYVFQDVVETIRRARQMGVFTMVNYLIFPGISDQPEELAALTGLVEYARPHLIHFKNLNIDPELYLRAMGDPGRPGIGMRQVLKSLAATFPELQFGYFNRTRAAFSGPAATP